MNKTVTVNIGGLVFHIDENAYERFKQYLESIRQHFTGSEGRDEIMQDIESRIAEMFQERVKDKQVITISDVEEVTGVMGKPEQFGDENESEKAEARAQEQVGVKKVKKLFRNPDEKVLGGVCSGVAAYFDVDTVWVRLGFALIAFPIFFNSFFGSALFFYVLLWFIIPEAKTTSEKLQMRGEPVTISNIEKNVVEERVQQAKPEGFFTRFFGFLGDLISLFIRVIGKIIAVFLLIIGVVVGFAVFASLLAMFKLPGTHYPVFIDHIFPGGSMFSLGLIGAVLAVGIPFLALAFLGGRILFKVKSFPRSLNFTAAGLWIVGIFICIYVGVRTAREFKEKQTVTSSTYISNIPGKVFRLKMNESSGVSGKHRYWDDDGDFGEEVRLSLNADHLESRDIKIDIIKSPTDSFKIEKRFFSRGVSRKDAADRAANIDYAFTQTDSVISFDNYFTIRKDEKYRAQKVQIVIYMPLNSSIYLDPSLDNYIYDIENTDNIHDHDMLDRTWKMSSAGLVCMDCNGTEQRLGGMNSDYHLHGEGTVDIHPDGVYIEDEDASVKIDTNGIIIKEKRTKKPKVIIHQ